MKRSENIAEENTRFDQMRQARAVFAKTLFLNIFVSASKLICGFLTSTLSMIADGFHSLLDASSNIIGIVALSIAMQPADDGHPYGHRKFEALAAMAISFILFFACFHIMTEVVVRVMFGGAVPLATPLSYVVMVVTIIVNVGVASYERSKADALNSGLLKADSQHTLSDIYVSLSVLAAILAAQFKLYWIDLTASLLIVIVILRAGYGIIIAHLGTLVDAAVLDTELVKRLVMEVPGVISCHKIRNRGMQDQIFIDLHVQVPRHLNVEEAHRIASAVERHLETKIKGIIDVIVHIEEQDDEPDKPAESGPNCNSESDTKIGI